MSIVIDRVTLENFKSYSEETTIELGAGVTAILGDNGAGKSTIQEGVGYALFDTHPFRNQDRLVREGESSGRVAVTFTNRADGDTYTVRRWAGRSKYEVLDENGDVLGLDTNSEVKHWICTELGVDSPDDLSEVWERSVGVPQTDFLSDFTQTEADRIDTFDPLFDIERYREAYKSLGGLEGEFVADIRELETDIARLDAKLEELPDLRAEVDEREETVEKLNATVQAIQDDIETVEAEKHDLESLEEELRDERQELRALEDTKIPAQRERLEAAKERRDEAENATETLEELEGDYRRHEAAQDRLDELADEREKRDRLKDRLATVGGKIDRLRTEISHHKEDLQEAQQAKARVEALEPKKEVYELLEGEIADLEDRKDRIDEIEARIAQIEDDIAERERRIDEAEAKLEEAKARRDEAERLPGLRDEQQDLLARKQTLENETETLREQNSDLGDIDLDEESEVSCPTCDQPVTAAHREEVIARNEARIDEITDDEIPTVETRISELEDEIESARDAKRAVDRIPRFESEIEDIDGEIEDLQSEKEELGEERDEHEDEVSALPDKRETLEELAGVVDAYHTQKAKVDNAEDVPEQLRAAREELGVKLLEYRRIRGDLSEFEGLDDDIEEAKETIEQTEHAHRTYVKNEDLAATLPERRQAVEDERATLDELQSECETVRSRVEDLRAEFDAERLGALREKLDGLKDQRARTMQKRDTELEALEEAREDLEQLEQRQEHKRTKEAEVVELERDQVFARWVRDSLQQGAEDLRDLVTSEIGDRANAIFQQLRGNPTETLVWDKTYNLGVRVRGQNKPFDVLSGGEKMAAALSVRLAVLEQLASVGVAFLDEPTANLDREKKRNLVNQLEELDQLDQLLVVSHDRTFESMTERTVDLEKDEDRELTRVVSD